jgi:hypothetical protein
MGIAQHKQLLERTLAGAIKDLLFSLLAFTVLLLLLLILPWL